MYSNFPAVPQQHLYTEISSYLCFPSQPYTDLVSVSSMLCKTTEKLKK